MQMDFRTNTEMISDFLWIREKFKEKNDYSSESEDNWEWIIEDSLSQTKSVQIVAWIRLWLSTELALELGMGKLFTLFCRANINAIVLYVIGNYIKKSFYCWMIFEKSNWIHIPLKWKIVICGSNSTICVVLIRKAPC